MFGKHKNKDKGSAFVCTEDCWLKGVLYRKGDGITADTCPPHFEAASEASGDDKDTEE